MKRVAMGIGRRQGSVPPPRCVVVDGSLAILRARNALVEVLREPTSLLITGLRPSGGCGLRLIQALRERGWSGRVVILTARPERMASSVLHGLSIAAVLKKPFKLERLREACEFR